MTEASTMKETTARQGVVVRVTDLSRRFRTAAGEVAAVDGVSLTMAAGSVTALTGASGSGKSTLLHLIGAIERADSGTIEVGGRTITSCSRQELSEYRRRVGFVFQRFHLLSAATALDNVIAPLAPYRTRFDKVARARDLLDRVGLGGREQSLPSQLSGGQQQRVAIARALVGEPELLLADEPTGNLDSATSAEIVDLLWDIRAERGMTMIIATHEAALTERAEWVVRLRDGRIISHTARA
jgi:putative ABC transport system ATP-binding protein